MNDDNEQASESLKAFQEEIRAGIKELTETAADVVARMRVYSDQELDDMVVTKCEITIGDYKFHFNDRLDALKLRGLSQLIISTSVHINAEDPADALNKLWQLQALKDRRRSAEDVGQIKARLEAYIDKELP